MVTVHKKPTIPSADATDAPALKTTSHTPPPTPSDPPVEPPAIAEAAEEASDSLEEGADAGQGGAFNPVTGEINWDCPCLGGMAHGPCGPQFREAFSCFVYSEDEPKGINCVDKFKGMQDCFREHPEIYAAGTWLPLRWCGSADCLVAL